MPLDIFPKSRKKEVTAEPARVVIDNRERNSLVPSELVRLGCRIEFKQLPVGDYICGQFIVERKAVSDLQSSIINKRIFSQLDALSSQHRPMLIIEGDDSTWKLHKNVYRGFILLAARKNIPVVLAVNETDTASYLSLMARDKVSSPFSFRPYRKLQSKTDIARYILEGFPGIGPATAQRLIDKFGSIKNIINAPEDDLKRVLLNRFAQFMQSIE